MNSREKGGVVEGAPEPGPTLDTKNHRSLPCGPLGAPKWRFCRTEAEERNQEETWHSP